MADAKGKLTNYAIGAVLGLVFYHYILRVQYPGTFPALGCTSCGQQIQVWQET